MNCICIDPAHVAKIWPLVSHFINTAMENGGGDCADVERAVLAGERLLWVAADDQALWAAAVTGLYQDHRGKFCCIWACGGREKDKWLPLKPVIEQYAKEEGCESMRIYGRKGWLPILKDYRVLMFVLEKRL